MEGFFSKKETEGETRAGGRILSCVSCSLYKDAEHPKLSPTGNFKKKILNVVSSPTTIEDNRGENYIGSNYRQLQKYFKPYNIDLYEDCMNTHAIKCHTEKYTNYNIDCCRKFLIKLIKKYKPVMIFLYGDAALYSVIGNRWRKDLGTINKWRGWQIPDQDFNCYIIPMLPLGQTKYNSPVDEVIFKQDLDKAFKLISKPFPVYQKPKITYIPRRELKVLNQLKNTKIAFDYETTGLKPQAKEHEIVCASIAINENEVYAFELPKNKKALKPFTDLLQDNSVLKVAQNMKFEDTWTNVKLNVDVKGWNFDTMLGAHILDNRPGVTGLKFQTYVRLGIVDYDSDVQPYLQSNDKSSNGINKIRQLWNQPGGKEKILEYCSLDSIYEYRIYLLQMEEFNQYSIKLGSPKLSDAYALFHDGTLAFAKAERQGLRIDLDYCTTQKRRLSRKIEAQEKQIKRTKFYRHWQHTTKQTINLNSNLQLANFLYGVKKISPAKLTDKGQGSTDEEALKMLDIPELDKILDRSKLMKIKDTYLQAFTREQVDGYLHPFFNLNIARTYRSSSSNPNFQNIPKRDKVAMKIVRKAIYPRPGNQLLEMDFGGIEVCVAATYHKDPTMIKYLNEGFDMHGDMAKQIFKLGKEWDPNREDHAYLRSCIKNSFVFPQFYGDYYKNCAKNIVGNWISLPESRWKKGQGYEMIDGTHIADILIEKGLTSYLVFEKHIQRIEKDFWSKRFPVYAKWKEKHYNKYLKNGYVELHTGFICQGIMGKNDAINYPVQGAAFHCLLWLFIRLDQIFDQFRFKSKIVGQIHDAVVIDVAPKELDDVYKLIKNIGTVEIRKAFPWINVPLKIDAELCPVDASWADKAKWNPEKQ